MLVLVLLLCWCVVLVVVLVLVLVLVVVVLLVVLVLVLLVVLLLLRYAAPSRGRRRLPTRRVRASRPVRGCGSRESSCAFGLSRSHATRCSPAPASAVPSTSHLLIGRNQRRGAIKRVVTPALRRRSRARHGADPQVLDPFVLTCERAMLGTSAGSPSSGAEVANLGQRAPPGPSGGIAALGFTRNDAGARVITVGADAAGTIQVWNWRSGALDAQGEAGPNRVLAVAAHPSVNTFVTCGVDHLKLWSFTGQRLDPAAPLLGALGRAQTFCCVEFVFLQYPGFGGDYEQVGLLPRLPPPTCVLASR